MARQKNTKKRSARKAVSKISAKEDKKCSCSSCFCCNLKKRKSLLIGLVLLLIIGLYLGKGLFVIALVNGRPVFRYTLIKELEKQGGQKVLDSLITQALIKQEAQKQKIMVAKEDIDKEIKNIEGKLSEQGQKLEEVLTSQKMTMEELTEQIRIQKLVEKLAAKGVTVSDQEVEQYLEANKTLIPGDASMSGIKEDTKQRLLQQKINDKIQEWLKAIQEKAKVLIFSKSFQK